MSQIGPTTTKVNSSTIGSRGTINFQSSGTVSLSGTDSAGSDQVTVTISGTSTSISNATGGMIYDSPIGTSNVYSDGPSCNVTSGTWFVMGRNTIWKAVGTGGDPVTTKLWDGGRKVISSGATLLVDTNVDEHGITLSGIYHTDSVATLKMSSTSTAGGGFYRIETNVVNNDAGNNASQILAIQLA